MNLDKLKAISEKAIKCYGKEAQKRQAIEECSELIQAICKDLNGKQHNAEEEVADVFIMTIQLFNIYDAEKVNNWINHKIYRLNKRIDDRRI